MGEHVVRMEEKGNTHRVLVVKSEGKRRLGRYRHEWEDTVTCRGCA
jgi:hypothetical protein